MWSFLFLAMQQLFGKLNDKAQICPLSIDFPITTTETKKMQFEFGNLHSNLNTAVVFNESESHVTLSHKYAFCLHSSAIDRAIDGLI